MNIYEIQSEIEKILDVEPDENGELNINYDALDALEMEKAQKIENLIKAHLNYKRQVEAFKAEIKALQGRQKTVQNRMESTKAYLDMLHAGEKAQYGNHAISYRVSEQVAGTQCPEEFGSYTFTPDKTAIKKAIKAGHKVGDFEIITNNNIQIK